MLTQTIHAAQRRQPIQKAPSMKLDIHIFFIGKLIEQLAIGFDV
jgi:hypothetical protein